MKAELFILDAMSAIFISGFLQSGKLFLSIESNSFFNISKLSDILSITTNITVFPKRSQDYLLLFNIIHYFPIISVYRLYLLYFNLLCII